MDLDVVIGNESLPVNIENPFRFDIASVMSKIIDFGNKNIIPINTRRTLNSPKARIEASQKKEEINKSLSAEKNINKKESKEDVASKTEQDKEKTPSPVKKIKIESNNTVILKKDTVKKHKKIIRKNKKETEPEDKKKEPLKKTVQKTINKVPKNGKTFTISHRLPTIKKIEDEKRDASSKSTRDDDDEHNHRQPGINYYSCLLKKTLASP